MIPGTSISAPWRDLALKGALWAALVFILFPGSYLPLSPGLDASYIYAVNALPDSGLIHGRDVAFPYGPLGHLLLPSSLGDNLFQATVFRLVMHLLFAALLAALLWSGTRPVQVAGFAALYLIALLLGLTYDYQLLLILALWLGSAVTRDRFVSLAAPLCTGLAVFFSLIKINLGLSALALVFSYLLWIFVTGKPGRWVEIAMAAGAFLFASAVAGVVLFGSLTNARGWLAAQSDLARGFGSAMSQSGDPSVLALGLAALLAFAVLLAWSLRAGGDLGGFWALSFLSVLLAFKHGFARQDFHIVLFFTFLLGLVSVGVLLGRTESEVRAGLGAYLAVLLCALPAVLGVVQGRGDRPLPGVDLVTGRQGLNNLRAALGLGTMKEEVGRRGRRLLRESRLPASFVRSVRARDLGVDVVPWELSYLPANGLRWVPSPVLQLYSAYTPGLDAWTARHFEGQRAPDLLLAEFRGINARNMVWDTPETWRAILRWYEPTGVRPRPGVLALRRRTAPPEWTWRRLGEERVHPGRWTRVPASDDWLFAELDLPLSLGGRLARTLFRLPPVYLETLYEDGRRVRWRVVPEMAGSGLLMNYAPRNLRGLSGLWRGGDKTRVVRFRLSGPGLRYHPAEIRVVWRNGVLNPYTGRTRRPRPSPPPAGAESSAHPP